MAGEPTEILTALRLAQGRRILPNRLSSAELRRLDAGIRRGSVFSARTTSAIYVSKIKEVVDAMAAGTMDLPTARLALKEVLDTLGYTPEGGFPDDSFAPGDPRNVPPAVAGTLQDLRSDRRLNLLLRTQEALMTGAAQKLRGMEEQAIRMFPAWELVRIEERRVPRDWRARINIALANLDRPELPPGAPLIFTKGDPVWAAVGSSELFDDALDVDHPPFAFESGMGWRAVPKAEADTLGIEGPEGQPLEEIEDALPRPKASTAGIAPDVLAKLKAELDAEEAEKGILTMKGRVKP